MKTVILTNRQETRLSEESNFEQKAMVEIGGKPILWHIMKQYSFYGFNDFIICCGCKVYSIKDFFYHYYMHSTNMTIDLATNDITYHITATEPWKVSLIDMGLKTMTGGQIKKIQQFIGNEPFMMTYGDAVSTVDVPTLLEYHYKHGKLATMTSVQPKDKFGTLDITADNRINSFQKKPQCDGHWKNAGFMVLQPEVFNYIPENDDTCVFEDIPLEYLAKDGQLQAYKHTGFWKPMNSLKDKNELTEMWETNEAPWKVWNE